MKHAMAMLKMRSNQFVCDKEDRKMHMHVTAVQSAKQGLASYTRIPRMPVTGQI